nr:MAG TPA: hypothetical protein [Caudoviricetes sp.]
MGFTNAPTTYIMVVQVGNYLRMTMNLCSAVVSSYDQLAGSRAA